MYFTKMFHVISLHDIPLTSNFNACEVIIKAILQSKLGPVG